MAMLVPHAPAARKRGVTMKVKLTKEQASDLQRAREHGEQHLALLTFEDGTSTLETGSLKQIAEWHETANSGMAALMSVTMFVRVDPAV